MFKCNSSIPIVWPGPVVFAVALPVTLCDSDTVELPVTFWDSVIDWMVVSWVVVPLDGRLVEIFTAVVLLGVVGAAEVTWLVFWSVVCDIVDVVVDDEEDVDDEEVIVDEEVVVVVVDDEVVVWGVTVLVFTAGDVAKLELRCEALVVVTGFEIFSENVVVSATKSKNKKHENKGTHIHWVRSDQQRGEKKQLQSCESQILWKEVDDDVILKPFSRSSCIQILCPLSFVRYKNSKTQPPLKRRERTWSLKNKSIFLLAWDSQNWCNCMKEWENQ